MPSESLSVRLSGINSASNGIGGGTGCNFISFVWIKYNYIDQSVVCVAYSFHMIYDYVTHQNHSFFKWEWDISYHGATEI